MGRVPESQCDTADSSYLSLKPPSVPARLIARANSPLLLHRHSVPYEKAGFRTVGALREAGYWLGRVCDEVVMDALAAEFAGPSVVAPLVAG